MAKQKFKQPGPTPAWASLDIEMVMAAGHLVRGGITDPEHIRELLGQEELNTLTIQSAMAGGEHLIKGPLRLAKAVRCKGCGAALFAVPCFACGPGPGIRVMPRVMKPT